ncbi:MAG: carboxypeptidase M32 [bacterium]|nr:carboxypeptidase M32 [bacterium]
MAQRAYELLVQKFQEIADINGISAIVGWDQQVNIPHKGHELRARHLERLAGIRHKLMTDPALGELFEKVDAESAELNDNELRNVQQMRRSWKLANKLPKELVERKAREETIAHEIWVNARAKKDFGLFAPKLETLLEISKEEAKYLAEPNQSLYDALIDSNFEQGASEAYYRVILGDVKETLVPLVRKIKESGKQPDQSFLKSRDYDPEIQKRLGKAIVTDLGFDWDCGRLDTAVHPFCTGAGAQDVRITTRYFRNWPIGSLFGIIHEAGHGMYEQGLPTEYYGTPLSEAVSMGVHESQSRFWENIIGRSKWFWKGQWRRLKDHYPEQLWDVSFDQWYFAINKVEPSFIRVEADECTYDLHILLRFELEADLFAGKISVSDLPREWNKKVEEYLGLTVTNDAEGVLQDVHWSAALFGYFPSYSLGNIIAGQLWAAVKRDIPSIELQLEAGQMKEILQWLRERIHRYGQRYSRDELVLRATGKPLSASDYLQYLQTKFGELYGV